MLKKTFESQFQDVVGVIGPEADYYRSSLKPQSRRHRELDEKCSRLADFYLKSSPAQQERLRSVSFGRSINANRRRSNLLEFIHRMALRILEDREPVLLSRGLACAAIINTWCDYRDLIVALIVLRAGAEKAGIDHVPHFDAILKQSDPAIAGLFTNARDHAPRDVRDILNHFGPAELKPVRKNRAR